LKKEAKTFATGPTRTVAAQRVDGEKFFGSFFQKRTASFGFVNSHVPRNPQATHRAERCMTAV
jgi:hypothetical protein